MTREAKVGWGCAVSSPMRCRFSASTFSSAGRAWRASMRPKAGSDSNSRSGLFTVQILSDVRQHPGEGGAAAHESADAGQRAAAEAPRQCFAVRCGQQKGAPIHRIAENVDRRRAGLGGAPVQDLFARGGARLFLFPFVQQVARGDLGVLDADAAETAKGADGVDMLVGLQAVLGIAVSVGHESVD